MRASTPSPDPAGRLAGPLADGRAPPSPGRPAYRVPHRALAGPGTLASRPPCTPSHSSDTPRTPGAEGRGTRVRLGSRAREPLLRGCPSLGRPLLPSLEGRRPGPRVERGLPNGKGKAIPSF